MRAWIYNRALLPLTSKWYEAVLQRIPEGSRLLDVGIGTGGALINNRELLRSKNIEVVGIDIDEDYVRQCQKALNKHNLGDCLRVELESVYDFDERNFDAVYFSASFMLLPDPKLALAHVCSLMTEDGRLYFTQTIEESRSFMMEKGKPLLKKLTSIDFGQVTYEDDFLATMETGGVDVLEKAYLGGNKARSYRLFVGRPNV